MRSGGRRSARSGSSWSSGPSGGPQCLRKGGPSQGLKMSGEMLYVSGSLRDKDRSFAMSDTSDTTAAAEANPLLTPWETPHQTPPFDEIRPEHFLPAFERAFADHAAEIAAITHDPSAPDFSNTITALERSGKLLSRVSAVFYDLVSANSNPEILAIDKEVSPRMARHWNPIMMNAVLFGRIALIHNNRATLGLTTEQMRLLERTYNNFHRAGAGLDETAKARRAAINER